MSNLIKQENDENAASVYQALKTSLYPGASDSSIEMVLNYCRAAKLDPMMKPVHLVPMKVSTGKKDEKGFDIKEMRDIVMPGINLYRILAARSGCAGISEPEFGPNVTESLGGVDITYPEWCKITVKRVIGGRVVEFTAKEFWKENYAPSGSYKNEQTGKYVKSEAPNAMWKKRPYGQIAKCAEAQAHRKAFPEICVLPTAEEMEGKNLSSEEFEEIQKIKPVPGKGVNGLKEKLGLVEEQKPKDANEETGEIIEPEVLEKSNNSLNSDADTLIFLLESATTKKELMEAMKQLKDLSPEDKNKVYAVYKKVEDKIKS